MENLEAGCAESLAGIVVCRELTLVWRLDFALCLSFRSCASGARSDVKAEDAEVAGGFPDFGQGGFELGRGVGFDVEEELVFPGAAVDGAAFDFLQVDAVFCEGRERGEECARAVGQAHGNRHFARVGSGRCGFGGGAEEDEAGEIFGVVLKAGG